jgi:RNA polymerase sigma-70 factor (ECF subfamily)
MQRDLVERAMAGDHDAFTELARVSIDRLYVVARLILRDDGRAEDATQEALVAAWRRLAGLRDPDRFEAWLHRLLVNACYREARRGRRRGTMEVHVDLLAVPEAPGATDAANDLADRDQLERGFRRLDIDQRTVLVMHYYLGFSLIDAAEILGVPPGTVRSRLHRAINAMRAALEADARMPVINEGRSA